MKKKQILFLKLTKEICMLIFLMSIGWNQVLASPQKRDITIQGRVADANGPLTGVSITVNGNKLNGTSSDANGKFIITAPEDATLTFSHIGYKLHQEQVKGRKNIAVIMVADENQMEEVVVVGYGARKKESLTGAVSSLKSDEIVKTKAPSLAQVIQGKVAGLRIRQSDGEPGQFRSDINIRGFGTPLFIIDGVVRDGSNEFQKLNPEDIESISFLKDGTAAIYGMNSANGAIIVTTKKGQNGEAKLSFNSVLGFSSPTDVPQMANAAQYMELRNEAELNLGRPAYITQEELAKWQQGAPGYQSVDLYSEVFNKSAIQNQSTLSLNGGNEKVSYYGSLGYAGDNSLLKNDAMVYNKYTFRSNVSLKVTNNLTAAVNIGGRYDNTRKPWAPFFDIFKSTRVNPPLTPIYANNNPEYYNNFFYVPNPAAMVDADYTGNIIDKNKNLQTQFSLDYNVPFLSGLKLKGLLAYDYNNNNYKGIKKGFKTYTYSEETGIYTGLDANYPSLIQNNIREANRLDVQFQANYNKTINGAHNIGFTYVFEKRDEKANWLNGERKYDFFSIGEIDNGRESDQRVSGSSDDQSYLSHIGRLTYDFKGKYLAEFAFREDGSYRYAPDKRWAFFPSASIGWRISEEHFIKDHFKFVDNFKIRATAGRSGQDAGSPFQYIAGYGLNSGGYVFDTDKYTNGASSPAMINTNLTWVNVNMYNAGFDLSIFKRIFAIEFDVYQRERSGLLANRYGSLPNTFGSSLSQENLNGDRTQGIEFTLSHHNKVGEFDYTLGGNFNLSRTKNLYVERGPFTSSMDRWRNQSSNRWNDFIWGYQTDGRFQNFDEINTNPIQDGNQGNSKELPGDYVLKDVNGDGIIDGNDTSPMFWSGTPQIHFGFNISASWKNFDFYALFQGSALYTVQFDEVYAKILAFKGGNTPAYFYDRWHLSDPYDPNSTWIPGTWPAARLEQDMGSLYTRNTDVWRKDASYLRLKSVEIGYSINSRVLKKAGLDKLRIFANGNNLFTVTDSFVRAFDPEKVEGSYSAGLNYPLVKTFNFGLAANF